MSRRLRILASMLPDPANPRLSGFPSSPIVGRAPDDPYYKLARQAALPGTVARAARNIQTVAEPLRQVRQVQSGLNSAGFIASPVRAYQAVPAPAAPSERAGHSNVVPEADPLVVSDHTDSEAWLHLVAPAARTEFRLAKKVINEAADAVGDEQAGLLAQAMESLRRAIKKLADQLFPAEPSGEATNRFGDDLKAHDRAYINRLHLALDEANLPDGRKKLERAELADFHRRFYNLNSRLADNIHGDGEYEECKTLYLDAWRIVRTCRLYLSPAES